MDWRPIVVPRHVLAAFWWFAGYVGTIVVAVIIGLMVLKPGS